MKLPSLSVKTSHILCLIGSFLLLFMAGFHGSGFKFVRESIEASDAPVFLKQIVPPLFAHPSLHLLGLAGFGILAIFLKKEAYKVLRLLATLIFLDGALAFYLGGILPGALLITAAFSFFFASLNRY